MKPICALLLVVGVCRASVIPISGVSASQVRVQDELGQYHFAHAGGPNARTETRTADGVTRGGYSYVDGNGLVQSASYVSDPVNGFRVAATNLPAAPVAVLAPAAPALVAASPVVVPAGPAVVGPVAGGVRIAGAVQALPEVVGAQVRTAEASPAPEPSTETPAPAPEAEQASGDSTAVEAAPPALVNPYVPVQDTPEVIAARAQHLAAFQQTQARDSQEGTEESTDEPTETPETPEPSEAPSTEAAAPEAPSTAAPEPAAIPAAVPAVIPAAVPAVHIAGPLPAAALASVAPVAAVAGPALARVASVAAPSVAPVAGLVAPVSAPALAPVVLPGPVPVVDAAQYRVQDELGQFAFGHVGGPNSREEVSTADGITRGGYTYVDGNGLVQSASYVSDPVHGFRVAATNLPVQPAPTYIADSPEVAEAKAALFKAQADHIAKL